jgi:hypothetical protein
MSSFIRNDSFFRGFGTELAAAVDFTGVFIGLLLLLCVCVCFVALIYFGFSFLSAFLFSWRIILEDPVVLEFVRCSRI